jgi:Flp pilus assembly protein TadG
VVSGRGQSAVELAILAPVAMVLLVLAAQFAIIGRDALALGQMTYEATRWASSQSPSAQCSPDITTYMSNIAAPTIKAIIGQSGIACNDSTKGVSVVRCGRDAALWNRAADLRDFKGHVRSIYAESFLGDNLLSADVKQHANILH